ASGSPRRHTFFREMGIPFTVAVREVDEVCPDNLKAAGITDHLAKLKASAFTELAENDVVVTSDTIVWQPSKTAKNEGRALGKPKDRATAHAMLRALSGQMHEVYTSVCFTGPHFQTVVNDRTRVWFKNLSDDEIYYYIETCKPYDKAGSYGIQDWLGHIATERLEGCFFNVMGLPTRLVYKTLVAIAENRPAKQH
ncbi:MAG: Maf family nucleotide pyrophosphatase, partial [Marinirhabdus sp.]